MNNLKTIFWGYHISGELTFEQLIKNKVEVGYVIAPYTKNTLKIEDLAGKYGVSVLKPEVLKNNIELITLIKKYEPDFMIVDSYDKLIPLEYINIPKNGMFNMHEALLPKYRGQHCMNWAIINGEKKSGLTIHKMTEKFDDGDIFIQKEIEITDLDDINSLYKKICELIPGCIKNLISALEKKELICYHQNNKEATYFRKRNPEDGKIDWKKSAKEIYNLIRALRKPWPNAFFYYDNKKVEINDALPLNLKIQDTIGKIIKDSNSDNFFIICGDYELLEIRECYVDNKRFFFETV
ncbi:MAG TPA: methionyl-tRNA formyltransferase [bacterium]|nr:methionyl-tRNA formyltransferase [bacterium]